ncbi:MAG: ZIP family metal transporter [Oscillospiraceae bacterium]|jgi:ZIP family zinc transporter|nr:ZIP family metal transporter [Oscillospiraceae bacterium]
MGAISEWGYAWQALAATMMTFAFTAAGSAMVLFFKEINRAIMDTFLSLAAGVMLAAAFWSLLAPAVDLAGALSQPAWLPVCFGFLAGCALLFIGEKLFCLAQNSSRRKIADRSDKSYLPEFSDISRTSDGVAAGVPDSFGQGARRCGLLITSITLHNIPEGLSVGVAFGCVAAKLVGASVPAAWLLAFGIALQNFPEGALISLPLRREGMSRKKAFLVGSWTGAVEPLAGVVGVLGVLLMRSLLPFLLSFAAGAMIYVVVAELIPESQLSGKKALATLGVMGGFVLMTVLELIMM